jgi:hypothetical protein
MSSNLVLQANFVTNPFTAAVGSYNGLFYPSNGVSEESSGLFTAALAPTSQGAYTAKFYLDGGSYSYSGAFDLAGEAFAVIPRSGKTPVTVTLHLPLDPPNRMLAGTLSNVSWFSVLQADLAVFNSIANPATNYAGKYTMVIPPGEGAPSNSPGGYGYATITNNTAGNVTYSGYLGDGAAIGQSVPISQDGSAPLYVSLYSGKGSLMGWLNFTNVPPKTLSGLLTWMKPSTAAKTLYPGGFTNSVAVLGSDYTPPVSGLPLLGFPEVSFTLSGGNFQEPLTLDLGIATNNSVTNFSEPTNHVAVTFTPATGALTLTLAHPPVTAKGVVLQDRTNAAGWFLGTNSSGSFLFTLP